MITNGTTTHNGAYSYDGAGRLSQVVDSATSVTETYTWNADGTLASSPGPSYTRNFVYDEEGRLVSIAHGSTVAFQYGYAYDGGRRWRKDIANSVWTWYPCGVACLAGELVEQTSDLTGNTWTNSATYLRGSSCSGGLIRRNNEYQHSGILGSIPIVTNSTGSVLSNKVYDSFGVQQFVTGTSVSILKACPVEEGYATLASSRGLALICGGGGLPTKCHRITPKKCTAKKWGIAKQVDCDALAKGLDGKTADTCDNCGSTAHCKPHKINKYKIKIGVGPLGGCTVTCDTAVVEECDCLP